MKFQVGQTVWHKENGEGVVTFCDKSTGLYEVKFPFTGNNRLWCSEDTLMPAITAEELRAQASELIAKAEALEAATEQWQPVVGEVYAFWNDGDHATNGGFLKSIYSASSPVVVPVFQSANGYYWKHIAAIDNVNDLKNPPEWFKQRDGRWK